MDINKLITALDFYANPVTYHDGMTKIVQDHGKQARIALERPEYPDYRELSLKVGNAVAAIETALNDKDILVSTIDDYTFLNITILLKNVKPDCMREAKRIARQIANKHLPEFNILIMAESMIHCVCPITCTCLDDPDSEYGVYDDSCPIHTEHPLPVWNCQAKEHHRRTST